MTNRQEYMKAWKEAHKESEKAKLKAWKEANKEECNAYMKEYYKSDVNSLGQRKAITVSYTHLTLPTIPWV